MTYEENNGVRVTEVLREAGCTEIRCTSVLDPEAGVVCWYGIEESSGRIFEDIVIKVCSAACMPPLMIARNLYVAYLDWLENGRPRRWEVHKDA